MLMMVVVVVMLMVVVVAAAVVVVRQGRAKAEAAPRLSAPLPHDEMNPAAVLLCGRPATRVPSLGSGAVFAPALHLEAHQPSSSPPSSSS
jgi:heme/copper-type cytochrome/quinol oxidase subunit 2